MKRSGDIGFFKIVAETGVAAGIRRVEAVTADGALAWARAQERQLAEVAGLLKAPQHEIGARLVQIVDNVRALEKELARLKSKLASSQGDDLASQATDVKGVRVLSARLEGADGKALRETIDKLRDKLGSAVVLLGAVEGDKVALVAGVTADLTGRVKAGELVGFAASQVGGKGGGRPDMAQGGGTEPGKLDAALAAAAEWIAQRL